ncbi:MAG: hypothetical protein ACJ73S_07570 [Mycobacteriales bacterium]
MRPVLLTSAPAPADSSGGAVQRVPGVGWAVRSGGIVTLYDHALDPVHTWSVPDGTRYAVRADGGQLALAGADYVVLLDHGGGKVWERIHPVWPEGGGGTVAFHAGMVWATVPGPDSPDWWWVLDPGDGGLIGSAALECLAASAEVVPHPDGIHLGLSVRRRPKGAHVYWGRWDRRGGRPFVSKAGDERRLLVGVHPSGAQYLSVRYDGGGLAAQRFPDGAIRAQRPDVGEAGYVAGDLVLAAVPVDGGVRHELLDASALAAVAVVEYPPDEPPGVAFASAGDGSWLTAGATHLRRWSLTD